jgi:intracellular multiplication protein IcmX
MKKSIQLNRVANSVRILSCVSLLTLPLISWADYGDGQFISTASTQGSGAVSSASSATVTAINTLGQWMGFPLPTPPAQPLPYMLNTLAVPDLSQIINSQYGSAASYLAQTPLIGGSIVPQTAPFDTTYATTNNILNATAVSTTNNVWSTYTTPSTSTISVIPNVDMPTSTSSLTTYPCSTIGCEIVYSLLSTPDYTMCTSGYTSSGYAYPPNSDNCPTPQYDFSVASNLLGVSAVESNNTIVYGTGFPAPGIFSTYMQNQMPNMNADVLTAPLAYNSTQLNNVNNFVHNLTGSLTMLLPLPYSEYQTAYNNIQNAQTDPSLANQSAEAIFDYILSLKSFGAYLSIGLSDLEFVMGRRMPNALTGTSTAADESMMFTRRLFNNTPSQGTVPDNTWVNDMNQASPIVLAREQVTLLAEINYQLYLMRMQDEKILLTLAAMQLGGTASMAPTVSQPLAQIGTTTSTS